jgi:acyl-CoA synthetase (AMP-forming)/AMP-acid ligase II
LGNLYPAATDTPALLTFTSGSTGQPKAALRTHGFLLTQYQTLLHNFGSGDLNLSTMPIFGLTNLAAGTTSLIAAGNLRQPGSIDPGPVLAQIQRYHPTRAEASPTFWERLTTYCQEHHQILPYLRTLFVGGAPVFPRLLNALQECAPQAEIVAVYGSTEAEPIAHIARHELARDDMATMLAGHGLLVGLPVPQIQVRVLPTTEHQVHYTVEQFQRTCLPVEEPGEIVVSGAHVLPGYLHGQGDAENKFRVGTCIWHRTGDLGYLDAQGRLWLLGRREASQQDTRGTLYPFAVECALSDFPTLRRSAALVMHDKRMLALEFQQKPSKEMLIELQKRIAWATIDRIYVCKHLPVDKRHNAKIDYPSLRSLLKIDE